MDAYDALHGKGASAKGGLGVQGLGPAYGTKLLYSRAYSNDTKKLRPSIMDSNVVTALNWILQTGWQDANWTTAQYQSYLQLAHKWAKEWKTQPEVIERVLFEVGRSRELAIRSVVG